MYASTLTRATGVAPAAAMPVLTNGLAGAKLLAPMEEQETQTDLVKTRVTQDDETATFQTYKARDKVETSCQASGKAAYT